MLELLTKYLIEEALIVIPVLLILGKIVKEMDIIKDKFIPVVLLIIGAIFTLLIIGFNVDAIIQGVLVAGAAVYGHQVFKQMKESED